MTWGGMGGMERRHSRPRASLASIINGGILAVMLLGGGVSTMLYLGAIRTDVVLLQSQVSDLRNWALKVSQKLDDLAANSGTSGGHREPPR